MSPSLKGAESVHSDQHDCRMLFPQHITLVMRQRKNDQAVYNSYNKPTRKRKRNSSSLSTKRSKKMKRKKSKSRSEKWKKSPSSSYSFTFNSSSSLSTESENEVVHKISNRISH